MRVIFELSGSIIFETELNHAPQIGTKARFRTTAYKKGYAAGSLIEVEIGYLGDNPVYDFTGNVPTLYISANGFELIEAGPEPAEG